MKGASGAHRHRIIAAVLPEGMRRLSEPAWSRFGIGFAHTVPEAATLLAAAPGGILIVDPALSAHACDLLLRTAASVGAEVVLYTQWDSSIAGRILATLKTVVPLDIICPSVDNVPDRLARLLEAPYECSVPTLMIENLADAVAKLPLAERALVLGSFVAPHISASVPQLIEGHGFVSRTLERHFEKAGLAPLRDILRGAGVARSREMLLNASAPLATVAEQCGLRSESGLIAAYHWAVDVSPHKAAGTLDAHEFARRLAGALLRS